MHALVDVVAVLGSRHGLLVDPVSRSCGVVRFDRHTRMPACRLRAGVRIGDRELSFPLAGDVPGFDLVDQRSSPSGVRFIGMDAAANIRCELSIVSPFRPRDAAFSTVPMIALRLSCEVLPGLFRWSPRTERPTQAVLFLEVEADDWQRHESGDDAVELGFTSVRAAARDDGKDVWDTVDEAMPQRDRLVAVEGRRVGQRFEQVVDLTATERPELVVAWCTWSQAALEIRGRRAPFKYTESFAGLDAVCEWARENASEVLANARRVDAICSDHDLGLAHDRLLAYTLHSWLANTWYCRDGERDWFSVWEGNCYFHSTLDVEFTQSPFYLAVWPELLGLELEQWAEFARDGAEILGESGAGTAYHLHDLGAHAEVSKQRYSHDMAVEETCNWLILLAAHWRRSGNDSVLQHHPELIRRCADFLTAADSTGDGVPDRGVANTVDDASPAVQYGRKQVYLAVKTLAARVAAALCLRHLGEVSAAEAAEALAARTLATIEGRGWLGDHYAVLLESSGEIINPWTRERMDADEIPGWDAAHIYTANGLVPLDMVGIDAGLDAGRLKIDLTVATKRCLSTYGCTHSDMANLDLKVVDAMLGLAGVARNPGWVSMNMLRDLAAAYRGVDLRHLAQRYWDWQTTVNSRERRLFYETFAGNNLAFYPRGIAFWGVFDACAGRVLDRVAGIDRSDPRLPGVRVPLLLDADWSRGTARSIGG